MGEGTAQVGAGERRTRLVWTLYAAFLFVAFCGVAVAGILVDRNVKRASFAAAQERLDSEATMLGQMTASALFGDLDPSDNSLEEGVRALGAAVHVHLSLLSPKGELVADSEDAQGRADEGAGQEIEQARAGGAGMEVRGGEQGQLLVARAIRREGRLLGFARAAVPMTIIQADALAVRGRMATGGLIAVAIALVLGFGVSVAIVRPLRSVVLAARALGHGKPVPLLDASRRDEIGELAQAFNTMREAVVFRETRLREEMSVAQHIQTALLPRTFDVAGYPIAAKMLTATEVGGDYYDVVPVEDGFWLGIGDVAGHGLTAGLVMLMTHTAIASLVRAEPGAAPAQILNRTNAVVMNDIRKRLGRDEHVTLTVLRVDRDGRVTFAGAHEDILIYRAASGVVDLVRTPGTWVGVKQDISAVTRDTTVTLEPGDVMVLYTDGAIEGMNEKREMYGLQRLRAELAGAGRRSVDEICAHLVDCAVKWTLVQKDDISVVVIRRAESAGADGPSRSAAPAT